MSNWAMQDLAIVGPADDIDRFFTLAFTGNIHGRNVWGDNEPTFLYSRVCPIRPRDRGAADGEHVDGVVFDYVRGDIQLHFHIWTSWSYPEHFYLHRFLRDWPRLAFCCAINEDCGGYGGIIAGVDGTVTDTVEPPDNAGERRDRRRRARRLLRRWHALMTAGRPWRVVRPIKYRRYQHIRGNVTFDDYASTFRLETEADARRFARRFKEAVVRRQAQGSGLKAQGSRLRAQGSRLGAQGSGLKAPGSRLWGPGAHRLSPLLAYVITEGAGRTAGYAGSFCHGLAGRRTPVLPTDSRAMSRCR